MPLIKKLEATTSLTQGADAPKESSFGNAAKKIDTVIRNLHEGRFAPIVLRWMYFFTGLMGAGMIATGTILWSVKRRTQFEKALKKASPESPAKAGKGLVLVEHLNVGTVVGLPIAVAVYFWANRLLPIGLEERIDWEVDAMFIGWGLMFVVAICRPRHRVWIDMLCLAALAYGLIPMLNFFTTDRHLGVSLVQGDWVMAGFDLTMLGFGLAFALTARRMYQRREPIRVKPAITTSAAQASNEVAVL